MFIMEVFMKNRICFVAVLLLLLSIGPVLSVQAAAGGELTADAQTVTVTLQKPSEEPEAVSSIRFWLSITIQEGALEQPKFQFADTLLSSQAPGSIQSAAVIRQQDGRYIADIILAGKKEQDIFQGGSETLIGTLHLHPATQGFRAQIAVTGDEADDETPVLRYVSSTGQSARTTPISDMKPVTCSNTASGVPTDPFVPGVPVNPVLPSVPSRPEDPTVPAAPSDTGQDENDAPSVPDAETPADAFDPGAAPAFRLTSKNESRNISFRWSGIAGADGYQIYRYEEKTKKYTRIKTIANPQKTAYTKAMSYGTAYTFRVRAFKIEETGKRKYGKFSPAARVSTAPDKVKSLTVKKQKSGRPVLNWKQLEAADGYQIYRSTSKNGAYTRIKTIKNGSKVKYANLSQKKGRTYYYKVRAYVTGADGIRRYGKFSSIRPITMR